MLAERPAISRPSKDRRAPSPTARQVLSILEERIAQGVYRVGDWLPTERDLVQELGINRAAVRDAITILSESGRIVRLAGCRPRVAQPVNERPSVRKTPKSQPYTIAIVLPQHDGDYASREIMRGVSRVLRSQETPCRLLVLDINLATTLAEQLELEACAAVENENIAGAIVWPTLVPETLARWRRLQQLGHPVVFVDRCDPETPCDFVGIDNYTAAREAVEYLIKLGHTRIVHMTDSEAVSAVRQRQAGYRDAMLEAGLSSMERLWVMPHAFGADPIPDLERCLDSDTLPTAIFALNDFSAELAIRRLEARGVRVPDQISVIGFDDSERYSPRPGVLTTMRQPFERVGQRAAELFLQRLTSSDPTARPFQHILLPTQLIERSTCRRID